MLCSPSPSRDTEGSLSSKVFLLVQPALTSLSLGAVLVGYRYGLHFSLLALRGLAPCLLMWKKYGTDVQFDPDVTEAFTNSAPVPT